MLPVSLRGGGTILVGRGCRAPLLVGVDVHVNLIGCYVTDEVLIEGGPCRGRPVDRRAAQAGHAAPAPVRASQHQRLGILGPLLCWCWGLP
jgi:hypothetical protein